MNTVRQTTITVTMTADEHSALRNYLNAHWNALSAGPPVKAEHLDGLSALINGLRIGDGES